MSICYLTFPPNMCQRHYLNCLILLGNKIRRLGIRRILSNIKISIRNLYILGCSRWDGRGVDRTQLMAGVHYANIVFRAETLTRT